MLVAKVCLVKLELVLLFLIAVCSDMMSHMLQRSDTKRSSMVTGQRDQAATKSLKDPALLAAAAGAHADCGLLL